MSGIPLVPEQDRVGDDNLPTYDDLAAQNGPNSRQVAALEINFLRRVMLTVGTDSEDGKAG